ncbi:hypothetical protein ACQF61_25395, partial [Klebsiella pneumoniae]
RAYCLKTQPATGETYPKSDLFNKALINGYCQKALLLSMHSTLLGIRIGKPILNLSAVAVMAF